MPSLWSTVPPWLWIVFTLIASAAQTARNAMQRDLIKTVGTGGATAVRFLFGLPFAILFFAGILAAQRVPLPVPDAATLAWTILGAIAQIIATGLMLAAMRQRSFVVAIAYTKTEPVHVALFGLVFLGDKISFPLAIAILLATIGVMLMSWPRRSAMDTREPALAPAALGLTSAGFFALSAIGYRAGILTLGAPTFMSGASAILALGLTIQSVLIAAGFAIFDRKTLAAIAKQWRPSLLAGFMGAFASQFWFFAFAIDSAARVRTLALVEIIFAQIVTRRFFGQMTTARELAGMALMVAGVALLVLT